jgi:beta-lactamase superfamily II metal-dependent hydrolase
MEAPRHFEFGGTAIDVLAPLADYIPNDTPKNNDSLVLRIRYGSRSFLLTGDVEKPIEYRMLDENEISPVDVLKVAHHGSRTSSTESFLERRNPAVRDHFGGDGQQLRPSQSRGAGEARRTSRRSGFAPTGTGW